VGHPLQANRKSSFLISIQRGREFSISSSVLMNDVTMIGLKMGDVNGRKLAG
jgi:hypothetical protein